MGDQSAEPGDRLLLLLIYPHDQVEIGGNTSFAALSHPHFREFATANDVGEMR
jgi:hypothetical protein